MERLRRQFGLGMIPLVFFLVWNLPLSLPSNAQRLAAVFAAVVTAWITEALPLAVTALLIGPALVVTGVADARTAFQPYADPVLFIFIGGFFIAHAMALYGLDRRIAYALLNLPGIRSVPSRARFTLLMTTGFLSMWVSNTATAAIMMPIALGAIEGGRDKNMDWSKRKAVTKSLLATAYAASVGGLGSLVGSPPNLIAARFLQRFMPEFGFVSWMKIALPVTLVLLLVTYAFLFYGDAATRRALQNVDEEARHHATHRPSLGAMSRGEWTTLAAFLLAAIGWIVPGTLEAAGLPLGHTLNRLLPPGAVAMFASSLLFFVPSKEGELDPLLQHSQETTLDCVPISPHRRLISPVLPWSEATKIDWGIIFLFGGGISLGQQLFDTGLARILADVFVQSTGVRSLWALTFIATLFTIFFTEVCSNTATANMLLPIVIAVAQGIGVSPLPPALGVALASSCAFMLPIATGPNAVVYGSGQVPQSAMIRTGFGLNWIAFAVLMLMLRILCPLFGW